jgi:hypothetical protein
MRSERNGTTSPKDKEKGRQRHNLRIYVTFCLHIKLELCRHTFASSNVEQTLPFRSNLSPSCSQVLLSCLSMCCPTGIALPVPTSRYPPPWGDTRGHCTCPGSPAFPLRTLSWNVVRVADQLCSFGRCHFIKGRFVKCMCYLVSAFKMAVCPELKEIDIAVSWLMVLWSEVAGYQCFGKICCLHNQGIIVPWDGWLLPCLVLFFYLDYASSYFKVVQKWFSNFWVMPPSKAVWTFAAVKISAQSWIPEQSHCVKFEVFTAVTMKNAAFWDVTLWLL